MISIHLIAVIAVYHLFSVFFSFVLIWAASNSSWTLYRYGWCQQSGEDFAATHPWRVQRNTHRWQQRFFFCEDFLKTSRRQKKISKIYFMIFLGEVCLWCFFQARRLRPSLGRKEKVSRLFAMSNLFAFPFLILNSDDFRSTAKSSKCNKSSMSRMEGERWKGWEGQRKGERKRQEREG